MNYWLTLLLFSVTYVLLAAGGVPGLRTDRAGIALVGAAAMLATGMIGMEEAFSAAVMDYKSLTLLFGLMLLVGTLRLGGLFERLESLFDGASPHALLGLTVLLSGALSAFLVNDIVCVAFTPLLLGHCRRRGLDPLPHLLGLATASNLGSAAAITGNPQNMYIGTNSDIPYLRFMARLGPPALMSMALAYLLIAWLHRARLAAPVPAEAEPERPRAQPFPLSPALITAVTVVLFFSLPTRHLPLIALAAAATTLLTRTPPGKIFAQVDWPLLVLFAGLFVVVGAFRQNVLPSWGVAEWGWLRNDPVFALSGVSAVLSNVVSNVPAVMLFKDVIDGMPAGQRETAWLALSLSSTLAGNLTVLGSVANLIVVEGARREGVTISFLEYARVGMPLTLITLGLGVAWLAFVWY